MTTKRVPSYLPRLKYCHPNTATWPTRCDATITPEEIEYTILWLDGTAHAARIMSGYCSDDQFRSVDVWEPCRHDLTGWHIEWPDGPQPPTYFTAAAVAMLNEWRAL